MVSPRTKRVWRTLASKGCMGLSSRPDCPVRLDEGVVARVAAAKDLANAKAEQITFTHTRLKEMLERRQDQVG